jgi:glutamate/aspartate transport system substrate-binding protein
MAGKGWHMGNFAEWRPYFFGNLRWPRSAALPTLLMLLAALLIVSDARDASAQPLTGRLAAIAASKTIKLAYRSDAAPFSFVSEQKKISGYTIDLCRMIVESLEKQLDVKPIAIQWVPVTSQNRFDAVATGKADLECGSSSATLSRMKIVDFSTFVFVENTGLAVIAGSGFQKALDLAGKKIAVIAGTSNEKAIVALNQQAQLDTTIVQVHNRDAGATALQDGKVDAFASDKLLLVGLQFKYPKAFRILPDDLSNEFYAIALPRGDWALHLAVDTALSRIYRSGEAIKVFNRWFPQIGLHPSFLLNALYVLGGIPE